VSLEEHLASARLISSLTGLPVNGDFEDGYGETPEDVMAGTVPWKELQQAGVKRVSLGSALYSRVMLDLQMAAKQLAAGDLASASHGIGLKGITKMIAEATQSS
jgi:2-methylisocitrate lyase-like PEP mutase family enzyme